VNELGLGVTFTGVDAASGIIQRVGHGLLETVGAATDAGKAIKSYFKEFSVGLAIFAAGAMGLHALEPAEAEAREFGKAIALVATEADLAVFPQQRMGDAALDVAATFGKMPKDEAVAMYEAVGMGANNAAKATALMAGANRLSVAGNADLKTSIDALGGAMRAYGASFTDTNASAYADTMFTAMTTGKTTVQELAGSLGRVTSMASSLGLTFEETTAAISAMTSTGIEANQAVTGLHGAFANILHPEQHAAAEAQRLGIHFNSLSLKAKGLYGMLTEITSSKKFQGVETMKKLFPSVEGFNAIMQLTTGNMDGFGSALDAMRNKAGSAAKGFDIMADTMAFQEDRQKGLKSSALILIGQALEPMGAAALKFSNALLEAFTHLPAPMINFLVKAFALASTLAVIVGGAIALKAAIGMLSVGMSVLGVTFSGVLATVLPVVTAIGLVALAFYAFREAYDRNVGGFADFFDGIYAKVRLTFLALGQLFSDGAFSGAVLAELDASDGAAENFAIRIWGFTKRIGNFFEGLRDGFEEMVDSMRPTLQEFATALERLGFSFSGLYDAIDPKDASDQFDKFGAAGRNVGQVLAKLAEDLIKVLTWVVDLGTEIVGLAKAVGLTEDPLGKLKTALELLVAYKFAETITGIAGIGGAAVEATASAGKLSGALKGIGMPMTIAITFVIFGLEKLLEAHKHLKEIYGEDWDKAGFNNALNNLGFTHDEDYARQRAKLLKSSNDPTEDAAMRHYGQGKYADGFLEKHEARAADDFAAANGQAASFPRANTSYYLPDGANAASAASAYASTNATMSSSASADDIGQSVAAAVAESPPQLTVMTEGTMVVDGEVLGRISLKAQRTASTDGEVPVSLDE
jgi:TP901 family phage tail tape measure protein